MRRARLGLALCLAAGLIGSCAKPAPPSAGETPPPAPKAGAAHGGEAAHEHEAEEHEGSSADLDRPLEELFAARCEHGIKTYECDECRYSVGVVKAPASLFVEGLLKMVKVERRQAALPLALTGEVQFDERRVTHVSSQAEGIIRKVHTALGEKVKRGQPLIEIESVAVGEAQAAYLEAQGMLGLARRNSERLTALHREGISSQKEYLVARQELEAAEIRSEGALGKLTRLGMESSGARALSQASATGRLMLRAPSAGTVLEMHAVPGEVVKTEESLLTVGDNAVVWVWADIYERDVALITAAQARQPLAATVEVKAYPDEDFTGTVDFVSPAMSRSSRTVQLRVAVPNGGGRLLAGMFATVKVFLPVNEQTLAVPKGAVLEDEGRRFVFVRHHGDYYVRRPVTLGRTLAGWVEITKGLREGREVVADGAFLLKSDVLRSKMGAGCAD